MDEASAVKLGAVQRTRAGVHTASALFLEDESLPHKPRNRHLAPRSRERRRSRLPQGYAEPLGDLRGRVRVALDHDLVLQLPLYPGSGSSFGVCYLSGSTGQVDGGLILSRSKNPQCSSRRSPSARFWRQAPPLLALPWRYAYGLLATLPLALH